jgi:predicted RNA methylase
MGQTTSYSELLELIQQNEAPLDRAPGLGEPPEPAAETGGYTDLWNLLEDAQDGLPPPMRAAAEERAAPAGDGGIPWHLGLLSPVEPSPIPEVPPEVTAPTAAISVAKSLGRAGVGITAGAAEAPAAVLGAAGQIPGQAIRAPGRQIGMATELIERGAAEYGISPEAPPLRVMREAAGRLNRVSERIAKAVDAVTVPVTQKMGVPYEIVAGKIRQLNSTKALRPLWRTEANAWKDPRWWTQTFPEGMGSMVAFLLPGVSARRLALLRGATQREAVKLGAKVSGGMVFASETGLARHEIIDELEEKGATPTESRIVADRGSPAYGLFSGLVERGVFPKQIAGMGAARKGFRGWLMRVFAGGTGEMTEEEIQMVGMGATLHLSGLDHGLDWETAASTGMMAFAGGAAFRVPSRAMPEGIEGAAPPPPPAAAPATAEQAFRIPPEVAQALSQLPQDDLARWSELVAAGKTPEDALAAIVAEGSGRVAEEMGEEAPPGTELEPAGPAVAVAEPPAEPAELPPREPRRPPEERPIQEVIEEEGVREDPRYREIYEELRQEAIDDLTLLHGAELEGLGDDQKPGGPTFEQEIHARTIARLEEEGYFEVPPRPQAIEVEPKPPEAPRDDLEGVPWEEMTEDEQNAAIEQGLFVSVEDAAELAGVSAERIRLALEGDELIPVFAEGSTEPWIPAYQLEGIEEEEAPPTPEAPPEPEAAPPAEAPPPQPPIAEVVTPRPPTPGVTPGLPGLETEAELEQRVDEGIERARRLAAEDVPEGDTEPGAIWPADRPEAELRQLIADMLRIARTEAPRRTTTGIIDAITEGTTDRYPDEWELRGQNIGYQLASSFARDAADRVGEAVEAAKPESRADRAVRLWADRNQEQFKNIPSAVMGEIIEEMRGWLTDNPEMADLVIATEGRITVQMGGAVDAANILDYVIDRWVEGGAGEAPGVLYTDVVGAEATVRVGETDTPESINHENAAVSITMGESAERPLGTSSTAFSQEEVERALSSDAATIAFYDQIRTFLRGYFETQAALAGGEGVPEAPAAPSPPTAPRPEEEPLPSPELSELAERSMKLADDVSREIRDTGTITKGRLFELADAAFGGTQAEGAYTPRDAWDALEAGINALIIEQGDQFEPSNEGTARKISDLQKLVDELPTQTRRTQEQEQFQQFSTPPHYAFLAAWAANIGAGDVVMEPSAGLGGLAVHAANAGPRALLTNELSDRRAEILEAIVAHTAERLSPPARTEVTRENAEHINSILAPQLGEESRPTVVVMNPPFSQTAGRMGDQKDIRVGARHVEEALALLKPGGRLVAIVGGGRPGTGGTALAEGGMGPDAKSWQSWWKKIRGQYDVRANIGVNGRVYQRYGTVFPTRLLVIDKPLEGVKPSGDRGVTASVNEVAEAVRILQGVRDARIPPPEPPAIQPAGPGEAPPGGRPGVPGRPTVQPPAPPLGPGERPAGRPPGVPGRPGRPGGLPPGAAPGAEPPAPPRPAGRPAPEPPPVRPGEPAGGRPAAPGEPAPAARPERPRVPERPKRPAGPVVRRRGEAEAEGSVYERYVPQRLRIEGAKEHPSPLSQSASMASVDPPDVTYQTALPPEVVSEGRLSEAQLEAVTYAGQAHGEMLGDGTRRRGFFIGDGTGVGKGREIAGVLLDNWQQGRRKAVWLSETQNLEKSAGRDLEAVGFDPGRLANLKKAAKAGEAITLKEGVLYTTYTTLARAGRMEAGQEQRSRMDQIVEWLGEEFDGVIVFDESHNMGNATPSRGPRGVVDPALKALAGVELQRRLPNARVLYTSATGATEVQHLSYADRLGLWGEGTPFPTREDFVGAIQTNGLAAMELVARDMKQLGAYMARGLSYRDPEGREGMSVEQEPLEHALTDDQTDTYDRLAEAWQLVLRNIDAALEITESDGRAKGAALSRFWGTHQRFFNAVVTSMKMPSIFNGIDADLAAGRSVVLQLVNTGEAQTERAVSRMREDETIDDLDLTPRDQLLELVEKGFPTVQYEEYVDENGNIRKRPVRDSAGNLVHNPQAIAARDALLTQLGSLPVPESALDQLIEQYGPEAVAEITGRKRRKVPGRWTKSGDAELEKRGSAKIGKEARDFNDGKRRILVFSDKGGTGESYHADRNYKNTQRRAHYLLQAGWRADKAIQGFGRTHRSNQAWAPIYRLVSTNLNGERRFISTIARRLNQLGALTKGERQTGGGGIFRAEDNLESTEAKDGLRLFIEELVAGDVEGLTIQEIEAEMGLRIIDEQTGQIRENGMPSMGRFLNRILSLTVDRQNQVFDAMFARIQRMVELALKNGTLDQGTQTLRADEISETENRVVYTHEQTGQETRLVTLNLRTHLRVESFADLVARRPSGFYQNVKSGRMWAGIGTPRQKTLRSGEVVDVQLLVGPTGATQTIPVETLKSEKWQRIQEGDEAERLWQEHIEAIPHFKDEEVHLLTGLVLPIWDRIPGYAQIRLGTTDAGERHLGRVLFPDQVTETLRNLGVEVAVPAWTKTGAEAIPKIRADGWTLTLSNGWKLARRKIEGEWRVEVHGPTYKHHAEFDRQGVFYERIGTKTRYFIPAATAQGAPVYEAVLQGREVVDAEPPRSANSSHGEELDADFASASRPPLPERFEDEFVSGEASPYEFDLPTSIPRPRAGLGPDLMEAARILAAPARYAKLRGLMLGVHRVDPTGSRIELADVRYVRTFSHELGHAVDYRLNNDNFPSSVKARFPGLKITEKEAREELKRASEIIRPLGNEEWGKRTSYIKYRSFHRELMADLFSLWVLDPAQARAVAPKLTRALEAKLAARVDIAAAVSLVVAPAQAKIIVPVLRPRREPQAPPAQFTPAEFDAALRGDAFEITKGVQRDLQAETVRVDRIARKWEATLSAREREDVAAFVEGIGNINVKGDTFEAVKRRMTAEMHQVAREYRFEQELNRQTANQLMAEAGSGPEAIQWIADYIGHFYVVTRKRALAFAGRWRKATPHTKQRQFPTLADAVEAGLKPISTDIAYLYRRTAENNFRAAFSRLFARRIKNLRDARGTPVMVGSLDKVPAEWGEPGVIDHPVFRHVYARKTKSGKLILGEGKAYVHPSILRPVEIILGRPFRGPIAKAIAAVNSIGKAINVGFSFFHEITLFESAQATNAKFLNPVRGVLIGPIESRRLGLGFRPHLTHRAGLALAANDPLGLADAARHGLNLSRTASADYVRSFMEERLRRLEARLRGIPGAGQAVRLLRRAYEAYNVHLWDNVHVGHKVFAYHTLVGEMMQRAPANADERFIKETIASFVNDAFGGQEFVEVPTFRPGQRTRFEPATPKEMQIAHAVLFAPDWTISNIRVAGRAAKEVALTVVPGKGNPVARRLGIRYWRNMVATLAGSALLAQWLIWLRWGEDDEELKPYPWQNEVGHEWDVDVTPLVRFFDRMWGRKVTDERFYIHAGKQAREVLRYFEDFPKGLITQFGNKSSVAVRAVMEQATGHAAGSEFPMPWADSAFRQGLEGFENVKARAKQLGEHFLPFSFQANNFAFSLPQRKGMTRYKATQYWHDAIERWVDPTWWEELKDPRTTKDQHAALLDLMQRIDSAAESNGIDQRGRQRLYHLARGKVRSRYYDKLWRALEDEDLDDAEAAAHVLLNLGVAGRDVRSSARARSVDAEVYGQLNDAFDGQLRDRLVPSYRDIARREP